MCVDWREMVVAVAAMGEHEAANRVGVIGRIDNVKVVAIVVLLEVAACAPIIDAPAA